MSAQERPRLVYVLPRYDPVTGSHFFHLYELLARAAVALDIFVVVEKAGSERIGLSLRAYRQRCSWPPLRALELIAVLTWQRFAGRRYFYTHYSFYGAVASWLVTTLFGGRAYYWNAGLPWFYPRPAFAEAVFRFIVRHTLLVTGTAGLAREYQRRYGLRPERTKVLPNWVNVARFQSAPRREESGQRLGIPLAAQVVLFVHRLSRRKGVHLLPEIIAEVVNRRQDVMFVIVGDGPERERLKLEIRNSKLEPQVRLVGEVPHRDIPMYFRAADVFLMPSEEEGFPHVLLEAMAAGIPYVASDVGGVREITPPELQEYLVPSGRIEQFAVKIISSLSCTPEEAAHIVAAEQEWVKRYDMPNVLPRFLKLFSS